jgi:hypothetical protein
MKELPCLILLLAMHGTYGISTVADYLTATTQSFLSSFIFGHKLGAKLRSDSLQIFYWF